MTTLREEMVAEDAVLAMSEQPEGWGCYPLGVLIRRAILGKEKGGDLLYEFAAQLDDELEMLERAALAVQYHDVDDHPEYELALADVVSRLRIRLHAVREIDWRIKNPNWLDVVEKPAEPVEKPVSKNGARVRKPRKRAGK